MTLKLMSLGEISLLRKENDRCTGAWDGLCRDFFYCGRRTIGVPGLGLDWDLGLIVFTSFSKSLPKTTFYCGRRTIGVPGLGLDWDLGLIVFTSFSESLPKTTFE
jgi:hypothetical protein